MTQTFGFGVDRVSLGPSVVLVALAEWPNLHAFDLGTRFQL